MAYRREGKPEVHKDIIFDKMNTFINDASDDKSVFNELEHKGGNVPDRSDVQIVVALYIAAIAVKS